MSQSLARLNNVSRKSELIEFLAGRAIYKEIKREYLFYTRCDSCDYTLWACAQQMGNSNPLFKKLFKTKYPNYTFDPPVEVSDRYHLARLKYLSLRGSMRAIMQGVVSSELYPPFRESQLAYEHDKVRVTQGGLIIRDAFPNVAVDSQFSTELEVLVGGGKNRNKPKWAQRKKGNNKPKNAIYGTLTRPPQPSEGNQAKVMFGPKMTVYARQFKYQILLSTTGTQTFFNTCIYLYTPTQYTQVVAGSINPSNSISTPLLNLATAFEYYRVKRILCEYTHVIGSTTVVPPMIMGMDPDLSPQDVGVATYAQMLNDYTNAVQLDPHKSESSGYWVPKCSSLSYASATDNLLDKGWIPCDVLRATRTIADVGVIAICSGNGILAAPLTTQYGVIDVTCFFEFKLPD